MRNAPSSETSLSSGLIQHHPGSQQMRRVHIESKSNFGLTITDEMTKVPISSVKEVIIHYKAGDATPQVTLLLHHPSIDIMGEATMTRACPHCEQAVPQL